MLVASNTSPISNLAIVDRLHLLRAQFSEVWIPAAVETEIGRLADPAALGATKTAVL